MVGTVSEEQGDGGQDPAGQSPGGEPPPASTGGQPSEEEVRRQLEEQMRNLRVQDLLTQSVVSILNLAARRIGKEDERDLEQGRVGIEAVRALLELLEPDAQREVREALSQVQMLYARESGAAGEPAAAGEEGERGAEEATTPGGAPGPSSGAPGRGERKPPPGLWTPPGST